MRKHFVALESHSTNFGVISLEEEQIMLDEAAQDAAGATQDLAEAERIIEVSDALEDLAVVADGIEEATPAETQLVELAGQMAVAGTDVQPEEVVPAMEGYVGRRIATEGIRERAHQIWESIQRFLKQIWEKIESFFYKIFGTIPNLRKRIEALEKHVEDAVGRKMEDKKFKITSGVTAFCVDYKPVKNESELTSALKAIDGAAKFTYSDIADKMAKAGESLADIIGNFEPKSAQDQAKKMLDEFSKINRSVSFSGTNLPSDYMPGFTVKAGEQLMGNVRLAHRALKDDSDKSILGELDRARRTGFDLISAREKAGSTPADFEFQTMSLGGCTDLLKASAKLLDTLEDYKRGKGWKEVKKAKDKLESASSKAASSFKNLKDSEEADEKAAVPFFKSMLNFNQAYTAWVKNPAIPMLQHSLTSIRAVMVAVEKSVACYK